MIPFDYREIIYQLMNTMFILISLQDLTAVSYSFPTNHIINRSHLLQTSDDSNDTKHKWKQAVKTKIFYELVGFERCADYTFHKVDTSSI